MPIGLIDEAHSDRVVEIVEVEQEKLEEIENDPDIEVRLPRHSCAGIVLSPTCMAGHHQL